MRPFHDYLPITEDLFHDGLYVTGAGLARTIPGEPYPPSPHPSFYQFTWAEGRIFPEFSIILISEGKGVFETKETGLLQVEAGSAILLFPGIWHRYRPDPKTGWTEKWINFNGEFAHKLWERGFLSPKQPLISSPEFAKIEAGLEVLLTGIEQRPAFNSSRYALQLSHILYLLTDTLQEPVLAAFSSCSPRTEDLLVATAEKYIWTHSQLSISVQDIANHTRVNRRTLERRFMSALGHTVLDEITRCRFNRAERLLRETSLPIKTVVYLSGFGRPENMRQAFIQQTHLSPRAYRENYQATLLRSWKSATEDAPKNYLSPLRPPREAPTFSCTSSSISATSLSMSVMR